ncbi:MAG: ClpXP protease specificity-enhancing factor [Woeseia sp.]|nr:ClpXP protease specificity-enhancing factor [Woeseia sp.]|tara:strand:- start:158 stop:559 length:402 start_codon:yes stop_codon:yes gene_type:complete
MTNKNTSKRPYLIRAMHEWMIDNSQTPHIVVDVKVDGLSVPVEHIVDGKITLNISHTAAHELEITNTNMTFQARFGGIPFDVCVPVNAVMGIYAKETGQGMVFSEKFDNDRKLPKDSAMKKVSKKRSHLKIVS